MEGDRELTPEQWQLFWDLKEMFPNVSGAALKQHLDRGHEEITEMYFAGQLPAGDQFIGDSEPEVVRMEEEEPTPPPQPPAPVRPVGLMPLPQQTRNDDPVPTPVARTPVTPVTPTVKKDEEGGGRRERSKICTLCNKTKPRIAYCHCANVDPFHQEEHDAAEHCVCADCLKIRFMKSTLEAMEGKVALFCPVRKCSRVICRDLLLEIMEKPAMVEWMLGMNVSLRMASIRQIDREKKRQRDEEPALTPEDLLHFENILDYADADDFVKATNMLPDACFSWILANFDFGLVHLVEKQAVATKRKLKRRDKAGITHLVESRLKLQTTFTCTVCFEEYRTHLAVSCLEPPNVPRDGMEEEETHSFCAECVGAYARTAIEQNVIVRSGIGIKCMQPRCVHILMRAHIEQVLDARTLALLEPHFADEAILAAGLQPEKCQRCAFAAILEQTPEENPVFQCRRDTCRHQYCRSCGRTWDAKHEGKTCDQLDPELMAKRVASQLDEMLIHRCPRCNKPFVKLDGCNKITCPCGKLSCYVCKKEITGYDHFQDRNAASGKCPLWDDPTKKEQDAANAMLNREIAAAGGEVAEALRKLQ